MAILWEDDLEGTPTSGTPTIAQLTWASAFGGAVTYTAATVDGKRALSTGPSWSGIELLMPTKAPTTGRIRYYAQWSGTQTGHNMLSILFDTTTIIADAQIRNTTGGQVWNRWNFVSTGNTTAWAANTPWRFEYRWQLGTGSLLEVWTDPNSTGEPNWAITAAGTLTFDRVSLGTNTTSGLTVLFGGLALSEGERIGPVSTTAPLDTPVVTVTNETDPTTQGGSDGTATVTWPAIVGAATYSAGIASGLNQTTGFSIVSSLATSPYTFTGLSAGNYTVAIKAVP